MLLERRAGIDLRAFCRRTQLSDPLDLRQHMQRAKLTPDMSGRLALGHDERPAARRPTGTCRRWAGRAAYAPAPTTCLRFLAAAMGKDAPPHLKAAMAMMLESRPQPGWTDAREIGTGLVRHLTKFAEQRDRVA